MQEIEKLRAELDQIHLQMTDLFRKRLAVTQRIWEIKKAQQLPFFDPKREAEIIHRFDSSMSSMEERLAVQNILKSILAETKKFLEVKLK